MIVMDHHDVAAAATTVVAATAVVAAAVEAAVEAATCSIAIPRNRPLSTRLHRQRLLQGSQGAGCCSTKTGRHSWTGTEQWLSWPSLVQTIPAQSSPAQHGSRKAAWCALLRRHAPSARSNSRSPARPCTPPIPTQPTCTCFHIMP